MLCFALCIALIAVVISQNEESTCIGGYKQYGQNCYGYIHKQETWFDAESACRALGGHLAEPLTYENNVFVKGLAVDHQNAPVWLGAQDLMEEGKWSWASTSLPLEEFTDWQPGEPNDINDEDCMVMVNGHWNDYDCDHKFAFICQKFAGSDVIG